MNPQRVQALAKKELLRIVREPANLFLVVLFPLVLTIAFGFAFGAIGSGGDIHYTVAVVDDDASAWSSWFIGNVSATPVLDVYDYESADQAYSDLESGKVSSVLVIPTGFGASIDSFYLNPTDQSAWDVSTLDLGLDQGSMIIGSVVPAFVQQALTVTMYGEDALNAPSPIQLGNPVLVESCKLTQFDYMVPGMFSYAAIFTSMIVAQVFTEERQQGLLRRVAVTPTSSSEIFMGQVTANLITGLAQVIVVLGASYAMGFRPMGGLAGILVATVATLLLIVTNVGLGLVVAALAKGGGAATGLSFIFILPQMLLGSFVPAPESASRLVPSYYLTETLTTIFLRGADVMSETVLWNVSLLGVSSVIVLAVGIILYNRIEG